MPFKFDFRKCDLILTIGRRYFLLGTPSLTETQRGNTARHDPETVHPHPVSNRPGRSTYRQNRMAEDPEPQYEELFARRSPAHDPADPPDPADPADPGPGGSPRDGEDGVTEDTEPKPNYEEMFAHRFTAGDPIYQEYVNRPADPPPIVKNWNGRGGNSRGRDNSPGGRSHAICHETSRQRPARNVKECVSAGEKPTPAGSRTSSSSSPPDLLGATQDWRLKVDLWQRSGSSLARRGVAVSASPQAGPPLGAHRSLGRTAVRRPTHGPLRGLHHAGHHAGSWKEDQQMKKGHQLVSEAAEKVPGGRELHSPSTSEEPSREPTGASAQADPKTCAPQTWTILDQ
ncbi:unnamed protein product [Merluccius merluccius]